MDTQTASMRKFQRLGRNFGLIKSEITNLRTLVQFEPYEEWVGEPLRFGNVDLKRIKLIIRYQNSWSFLTTSKSMLTIVCGRTCILKLALG